MSQAGGPGAEHRSMLGSTVRQLRRSGGLTLRELADLIGVSPATLSGIENGKTGLSSERVSRIAAVLDVSVERLFVDQPDAVEVGPRASSEVPAPRPPSPDWGGGGWRHYPDLRLDTALAGALSSFLEFGYHGASMRTIAERAGLSVPGLYHYYASKHEMLVALLDLTMDDLRARTDAARSEGADEVGRFANIVECLALYHTHRRALGFVGASEMRSLSPAERARVAALRVDEQRVVDAAVADGVRSGVFATDQPHDAARAVVTMCTALAQWFRADGPASAEAVAAQYVDFALHVVRCGTDRHGVARG